MENESDLPMLTSLIVSMLERLVPSLICEAVLRVIRFIYSILCELNQMVSYDQVVYLNDIRCYS